MIVVMDGCVLFWKDIPVKLKSVRGAFRTLVLSVLAVFSCNTIAIGYTAAGGKILDQSGTEIQLRGVSHYGFNTPILQPQYLWEMGWKEQIGQMKSLGFNAIRVPFVPDTLYTSTPVNQLSYLNVNLNPDLVGKTPLEALDLWMAEADRQGMYILLDFHSVSMQRQYPTWFVSNPADYNLIYNKQAYTKENWTRDLAFVAQRYSNLLHFFVIDIYNEPNGIVRWSVGDKNSNDPANFWKTAAESGAAAVLAANPKLMIFVQGINGNFDGMEKTDIPMNWGEDFQPQAYQPLDIPANKLVLSPHTYGPDVYVKASFGAANFPANLVEHWNSLFGQFAQKHPVVVGEWGGKYGEGTSGQKDAVWQDAFVDYLISKGMRSSFYWCYTPNSGDTGGILDDKLKVRPEKMALLRKLWGATAPAPASAAEATPVSAALGRSYPQPGIASFAPASGPVGTVVTLSGSGFTGLNLASVGVAKNAAVTVVSDTEVRVTIPDGATSGSIGIFNPNFVAFAATAFSVERSAASSESAAASASSEGGGGALNPGWLLALGLAVLALRRPPPAARN